MLRPGEMVDVAKEFISTGSLKAAEVKRDTIKAKKHLNNLKKIRDNLQKIQTGLDMYDPKSPELKKYVEGK